MTVREYNLARQGYDMQIKARHRREAGWMAMILNTQYVDAEITAEQLLGEEPAEVPETSKEDAAAAEKRLAKMLRGIEARKMKGK